MYVHVIQTVMLFIMRIITIFTCSYSMTVLLVININIRLTKRVSVLLKMPITGHFSFTCTCISTTRSTSRAGRLQILLVLKLLVAVSSVVGTLGSYIVFKNNKVLFTQHKQELASLWLVLPIIVYTSIQSNEVHKH